MNSVVVVGRAGQDAERRPPGDPGDEAEVTDWFNIDVWDKQAEFAGEYIKKGRLVVVDGRIQSNKWKDASGEERERYLIVANNVRLLGSKRDAE